MRPFASSLLRASIVASVLLSGGTLAGCASSKATGGDGGKLDASVDADEDATTDTGGGPDDVLVYPEAPSLRAPDGCMLSGATCMTGDTCCSAYCVDGGCQNPAQADVTPPRHRGLRHMSHARGPRCVTTSPVTSKPCRRYRGTFFSFDDSR